MSVSLSRIHVRQLGQSAFLALPTSKPDWHLFSHSGFDLSPGALY